MHRYRTGEKNEFSAFYSEKTTHYELRWRDEDTRKNPGTGIASGLR